MKEISIDNDMLNKLKRKTKCNDEVEAVKKVIRFYSSELSVP